MTYRVGIITASDKGYAGTRKDLSGPRRLRKSVAKLKAFKIDKKMILPDDKELLATRCAKWPMRIIWI
jgi:molybdopterin biosynthesis enzyme MoaB